MHLILRSPEEDVTIEVGESIIRCFKLKKLLGIHTGYKLKFDAHVKTVSLHLRPQKTQCTYIGAS